ncbi:MAG: lipopolysaccharide biosynthesis protein [Lentisphaeria bacterium]|nr:lipopolysaccharide biosynthesis protein [Lentisphaeria bacterium]
MTVSLFMNLKSKIVSGVFWQGFERVGSQGMSLAVSIMLARLLAPKEFGVIALLTVFISLCNVMVDSGLGGALIQKKDADQLDFCSVFYVNIVMGAVGYGVLFLTAPLISAFYKSPGLTLYMRVLALTLFVNAFSVIQRTILNKNMWFYLSFRISWGALIVSGTVGIVMAYCGFKVWALVAQSLTSAFVGCVMLWALVKWRPCWIFDWRRAWKLFQFGWKLLVSGFLDTLYNDIYSVVIGKISSLTDLAYYNRGKAIPALGMGVVNSSVGSVLFPAFSSIQDDRTKMRELAKRGLQNIMFAVIPALTLLFILAKPLVQVVLTEKWLPSVVYLQLCCVTFFFWPFHTMNLQIITACGRSDLFLLLEIIKKVQAALVIFITYRYGVVVMVAAGAAMGLLGVFENAWCNRKLIGYAPWTQLWDILPLLLVAAVVGCGMHWGVRFVASPWCKLIVGGGGFVILYLIGAFILKQFPQDILNLLKFRRIA